MTVRTTGYADMNNKDLLKKILENNKNNYMCVIKAKYPHLIDWINDSTPLLQSGTYSMKTKIYWVLNDLHDFPLCRKCGKPMIGKNVISTTEGYHESCSVKCASGRQERIQKIKNTCLEKYGVSNYTKTQEFQSKSKETCMKKYGVPYSFQSDNNKDKSRATCIERYGTASCMQNESIQNKVKQTNLKKYGVDNVFKSKKMQARIRNTLAEKYGADSPMKVQEIKEKACRLTNLSKLERSWYHNILGDPYSIPDFDRQFFIDHYSRDFEFEFICKKCGSKFTSSHYDGVHSRCKKCYPNTSSFEEKEIAEYIRTIYDGELVENSKNIIHPYELDIYIPSKKIAFEFDGLYWHSSQVLGLKGKASDYHLKKTEICESNGIRLIHIFEDEWRYKKEIVKRMICDILQSGLHGILPKLYEIKEIDQKTCKDFIDANHVLGYVNSSARLGMFVKDRLVSAMMFCQRRVSTGSRPESGKFELVRFCSLQDYDRLFCATKMLENFQKNYSPVEITAYSDRRWNNGRTLTKLGFVLDHVSKPSYWYIDNQCLRRYHRFEFRKSLQPSKLEKFDTNLTEKENMEANGYRTVYDCGSLVFKKSFV